MEMGDEMSMVKKSSDKKGLVMRWVRWLDEDSNNEVVCVCV